MPAPDSAPAPSQSLLPIDGLRHDVVLAWLERALRGEEPLPLIVPDETPEAPILRCERSLSTITRQDLRQACLTLLRRYVREPHDQDEYVLALLRLATGFHLGNAITDLHVLAATPSVFKDLPATQSWAVLSSLVDLRAPLSIEFWKGIASDNPAGHGALAASALLAHGYHAAMNILPALPDEEGVADALYVVLDQHAGRLTPEERQKMVAAASSIRGRCEPHLQEALQDWIAAHAEGPVQALPQADRRSRLDTALAGFASRSGQTYRPSPGPARLLPLEMPA